MDLIERSRKVTGKQDVSKEPGIEAAVLSQCVQESGPGATGSPERK